MMEQFTWQHFILFILSAGLPYYLVVLLLYFRKDIRLWSSRKTSALHYDPGGDTGIPLMGNVREEPGLHTTNAQELKFAPPDISGVDELLETRMKDEEPADGLPIVPLTRPSHPALPDTLLLGDIADLLRDLNTLFSMSAEAGKEEFISLFSLITSRYQKVAESHLAEVVDLFILEQAKEKLPFELSPTDLQRCWLS